MKILLALFVLLVSANACGVFQIFSCSAAYTESLTHCKSETEDLNSCVK